MKAVELLAQAQSILTTRAAGGLSARMAAFLARRALEDVIDARCIRAGARAPRATTRSQLLILRVLDDETVARQATVAWHRLSNACHLHAYELQPSVAEVEHLCGVVAKLIPVGG
jgi:hypothetical protein